MMHPWWHAGIVHATQSPNQTDGQKTWTAAELSNAYSSGQLTPSVVAARILARMEAQQDMAIFIACDARDIQQQAEESTLR